MIAKEEILETATKENEPKAATVADYHHDDSNPSRNIRGQEQNVFLTFTEWSKRALTLIDLEPTLFVHGIVYQMTAIMINEFLFYKACVVNENLTEDYCERNKTQDEGVAQVVADIKIWREVIESVFSVTVFLFIGVWSDLYGRKLPIVLGMSGFIMQVVGVFLCLLFPKLTAEVSAVITVVPLAITSGTSAINLAAYSHGADQTDEKDRTLKMAMIYTTMSVGTSVGAGLTSLLKAQNIGYYTIFGVAGILELCAIVYVIIFIKNTNRNTNTTNVDAGESGKRRKTKWTSLFSLRHVIEMAKALFRSREGHLRLYLMLLFAICLLNSAFMSGEVVVLQQYAYKRFDWDTSEFSLFNTIRSLINSIGGFLLITFLVRVLKLRDSSIGIVSSLSQIGGSLTYAFADQTWMMYLGATVDLLDGGMLTTARSCISKIVPREELGKVLSFTLIGRDLMPLVMDPAYAAIFRWTMNSFPGTFYIVSTAFSTPILIIYLYFHFLPAVDSDQEIGETQSISFETETETGQHVPIPVESVTIEQVK